MKSSPIRRVLILGGAGIIGKGLAEECVNMGYRVTIVRRGTSPVAQLSDAVTEVVSLDVHAKGALTSLSDRTWDTVIDLVSFSPGQLQSVFDSLHANCSQYIFVSSATVFDDPGAGLITENSPRITHGWQYPLQKIACERLLEQAAARFSLPTTIVRPYITYADNRLPLGVWESGEILGRIAGGWPVPIGAEISSAATTLTHTKDLATCLVGLIQNPKAMNEDFNVVVGKATTWQAIYEGVATAFGEALLPSKASVEALVGAFPELRGKAQDRTLDRKFDCSKLRDAIGNLPEPQQFQMDPHSIREFYAANEIGGIDYFTMGRQSELIKRHSRTGGEIKAEKQLQAHLRRQSFHAYSRYKVGASPNLRRLVRLARSRNQSVVSPYLP